jgi:hypothetical protein
MSLLGLSLNLNLNLLLCGEAGIRTLDTASGIPVFETGAFNHSATSPRNFNNIGKIEGRCNGEAVGRGRHLTQSRKLLPLEVIMALDLSPALHTLS